MTRLSPQIVACSYKVPVCKTPKPHTHCPVFESHAGQQKHLFIKPMGTPCGHTLDGVWAYVNGGRYAHLLLHMLVKTAPGLRQVAPSVTGLLVAAWQVWRRRWRRRRWRAVADRNTQRLHAHAGLAIRFARTALPPPPPDTTHKPLVTSTLTAQMPSAQSSIAQRTQRRLAREFKLASTPITEVTKDAKPAESEDQKEAGAANGQEQAALQPASCKEKGDAALGTAREEVCLSVLLCHKLRIPLARAATPVPPLAC